MNEKLEAMCPHCFGKGCEQCGDGRITLGFKEGDWYTSQCNNPRCYFENGVGISDEIPSHPSGPCVVCKEPTEWILVEEARSCTFEGEPPHVTNQWEFAYKGQKRIIEHFKKTTNDLRKMLLPLMSEKTLTVEEAKLLQICSICHGKDWPRTNEDGTNDPFQYKEYAHVSCLNKKANHAIPSESRI